MSEMGLKSKGGVDVEGVLRFTTEYMGGIVLADLKQSSLFIVPDCADPVIVVDCLDKLHLVDMMDEHIELSDFIVFVVGFEVVPDLTHDFLNDIIELLFEAIEVAALDEAEFHL